MKGSVYVLNSRIDSILSSLNHHYANHPNHEKTIDKHARLIDQHSAAIEQIWAAIRDLRAEEFDIPHYSKDGDRVA